MAQSVILNRNKADSLYNDKLVSGTNIKTIGSLSILGSGNIAFPVVVQDSMNPSNQFAPTATAVRNYVDAAIVPVYVDVTTTSITAVAGRKYKANNDALVTITLPSTGKLGDQVLVRGYGIGKWRLNANAGAIIHGNNDTASGGYLSAQARYDTVAVEVIALTGTTPTEWTIIGNRGTLNYDTI